MKQQFKINKKILNISLFLILLFAPFFNQLYNTYVDNHSFKCSATKTDNHLHNEHKFFYTIVFSNENYNHFKQVFSFENNVFIKKTVSVFIENNYTDNFQSKYFVRPPPSV